MIRKLIRVSILFLASLTIFACDKLTGPSPSNVLDNYLDASLKNRSEEAYSYISDEDKAIKDLQSYLKENEKKVNPFAQAIVSKISYKILKLDKSEKKASADVEITQPDLRSMSADITGAAFKSAFGGGGEKEMEKSIAKKFESGEVPLTTMKKTFQLVKEKDGWKVYLDWKTKKANEEKQATIKNLLKKNRRQ